VSVSVLKLIACRSLTLEVLERPYSTMQTFLFRCHQGFRGKLERMRFLLPAALLFILLACQGRPTLELSQPKPGYQIQLVFSGGNVMRFQSAFQAAAQRWEGIVQNEFPDFSNVVDANDCLNASPYLKGIDDVVILVETFTDDGPGGLLGQA
jgi:hypothetical protein